MTRYGLRYRPAIRRIDVPTIEGCWQVFDRQAPDRRAYVYAHTVQAKAVEVRDILNAHADDELAYTLKDVLRLLSGKTIPLSARGEED